MSSSEPSKRSAQRCVPLSASISCAVMVSGHPLCGLNLPQDVSDAELAADPFMSTGWPLYVKLELRAMTKSQRMRESAVMISSTMPSAKILLLGVSAYIGERQHCDRRLIGQ